jgi:hypothetical protein
MPTIATTSTKKIIFVTQLTIMLNGLGPDLVAGDLVGAKKTLIGFPKKSKTRLAVPTRSAKIAAQTKPSRNASSATNLNNTASLKYSRMELIVSTGT